MHSLSTEHYQQIKQNGLDKAQLTYGDIAPILQQHQHNPLFSFSQLGQSVLGVPIWQVELGSGPVKILAWSQMHGNESTASAALMDVLNFISAPQQQAWREQWLSKVTLRLIPMLNPDGAAAASRFNSMGIDVNRDAKALQSPEARILLQAAQQFRPDFGLNLHDQNRCYAVGYSDKPATISLLAPAFNADKDIDNSRRKAMQLVADMAQLMALQLPGYLAKYDDTFCARSFGDTLAGMGISTVLIEAGGYPADNNRQMARRLITQLLLTSIESTGSGAYQHQPLSRYQAIPYNRDGGIKDLIISHLRIMLNGQQARVDVALQFELSGARVVRIDDIGDLSAYGSYQQFNADRLHYQAPKAYPLTRALTLDNAGYLALLKQGFSHFSGDVALLTVVTDLPLLLNPKWLATDTPLRQQAATFLLASEQGVELALLNGQLLQLSSGTVLNRFGC